eukprot:GHVU01172549.1.p1 GENE.GHVU01172549.1~~GHVU01172549.1.p1  ORF type:complete len:102 (-),score=5.48 GHVU01172549.1:332-637(-)
MCGLRGTTTLSDARASVEDGPCGGRTAAVSAIGDATWRAMPTSFISRLHVQRCAFKLCLSSTLAHREMYGGAQTQFHSYIITLPSCPPLLPYDALLGLLLC